MSPVEAVGFLAFRLAIGASWGLLIFWTPRWLSVLLIVAFVAWVGDGVRQLRPGRCIYCEAPTALPLSRTPQRLRWYSLITPRRKRVDYVCPRHLLEWVRSHPA